MGEIIYTLAGLNLNSLFYLKNETGYSITEMNGFYDNLLYG